MLFHFFREKLFEKRQFMMLGLLISRLLILGFLMPGLLILGLLPPEPPNFGLMILVLLVLLFLLSEVLVHG